jgi:hypothetical protein
VRSGRTTAASYCESPKVSLTPTMGIVGLIPATFGPFDNPTKADAP